MPIVCCYDKVGRDYWFLLPSTELTFEEMSLIRRWDREIRSRGVKTGSGNDYRVLIVRMDPLPRTQEEFLRRLTDDREPAFVLESSCDNVGWTKVADSIDMRTLQEYVVRNTYDGKTFWRIRETPNTIRWSYPS